MNNTSYIYDFHDEYIWIYKFHSYVTVVTFLLNNKSHITVMPKDQHVKDRFEVFMISLKQKRIDKEPLQKLKSAEYGKVKRISIISKYDWELPTTESDKAGLLGDTVGSTTVFEGRELDECDLVTTAMPFMWRRPNRCCPRRVGASCRRLLMCR